MRIELPTKSDLEYLLRVTGPECVSWYLPTTPTTDDIEAERIAWKNQSSEAIAELTARGVDKRRVWQFEELIADVDSDANFWHHQARTLAVFTDGDHLHTFRLPNHIEAITKVADRFFVKPLLRSVTFPSSGLILALSAGSVRVLEVGADFGPVELRIPDMPTDAAAYVGTASLGDRAPAGRIQGDEGRKVRLAQYARAVDRALRAELHGQNVPVVLAATDPMGPIFRSVSTLSQLADEGITSSPENMSDLDLAAAARGVIDRVHDAELARVRATYDDRVNSGRAVSDLSDIARFATTGQIDTLLVDIDGIVPGTISDTGELTLSDDGYGVVDEMARRTLAHGGRVLAVRTADLPAGDAAAALLRWV